MRTAAYRRPPIAAAATVGWLTVAVALTAAGDTRAATVFSEGFDGENAGASATNYTGFSNWTVSSGTVDLVRNGDFGVTCHGGAGSCVDLQGSDIAPFDTLNGDPLITFGAGDVVTVSFWLSGSQRGGADDFWTTTLIFTTPQDIEADVGGAFKPDVGPFPGVTVFTTAAPSHAADPFQFYRTTFTSSTAGAFHLSFQTSGQDLEGPILDDVLIDVSPAGAAPEPAGWALMLSGFAAAGAALRARRSAALVRER